MKRSHRVVHLSLSCLGIGSGFMSFALFLHPMDPIDFLAQVLTTPLETMVGYGGSIATLFWIGVMFIFFGIVNGFLRKIIAKHIFWIHRMHARNTNV